TPDFHPMTELAWILAADEKHRDALRAFGLAKQACEITGYNEPQCLSTLGMALAENGRFEEAAKVVEKAAVLSKRIKDSEFRERILDQLKLFRNGERYHGKPIPTQLFKAHS